MDVPEAELEETEHGLVYKGEGWFVVNAEEVRWRESEGCGRSTNFGGDVLFDQIGIGIDVLGPGEPMSMYHWESDEEDFLILSGTATLIVEGQERPLRRWDFVHCPPYTEHTIVGGPQGCVVFGVGSRERHTEIGPDGTRRGKEGKANTPSTRRRSSTAPGSSLERRRTRRTPAFRHGASHATVAGSTRRG